MLLRKRRSAPTSQEHTGSVLLHLPVLSRISEGRCHTTRASLRGARHVLVALKTRQLLYYDDMHGSKLAIETRETDQEQKEVMC